MPPGVRVLFVVLALGAWAACIIACRPAWSPDSKQVLFAYRLASGKGVGVALHDRESGKTRHVYTILHERDAEFLPVGMRWLSDGKRFVTVAADTKGKDSLLISLVDASSGDHLRMHRMDANKVGSVSGLFVPPALVSIGYVLCAAASIGLLVGVPRVGGDVVLEVLTWLALVGLLGAITMLVVSPAATLCRSVRRAWGPRRSAQGTGPAVADRSGRGS